VGAGGRIAFSQGIATSPEQARLLRSEGVAVKDGRVALAALLKSDEFLAPSSRSWLALLALAVLTLRAIDFDRQNG